MKDRWGDLRIMLATVLTGVVVGVMGARFLGTLGTANSPRVALIAAAEAHCSSAYEPQSFTGI